MLYVPHNLEVTKRKRGEEYVSFQVPEDHHKLWRIIDKE